MMIIIMKMIKEEKGGETVVPLKYLRSFCRTLDIPLIGREINPILTWFEDFVLTHAAVHAQGFNPPRPENATMQNLKEQTQNCMYQLFIFQMKMIINY